MGAEEVTERSRLSVAARYESLVRVSNAIGTHRDPQDLFSALARELHRVVRFDYIGVSTRRQKHPYLRTRNWLWRAFDSRREPQVRTGHLVSFQRSRPMIGMALA
jgi:transcriptional regulator with GAF, ATPase, and Fis domain